MTNRETSSSHRADAPAASDAEIRERAYDIWERHHRPEGFGLRSWLLARRELLAGRAAAQQAETSPACGPEAGIITDGSPESVTGHTERGPG
ncbi:DUF2934 domain-containing protein [Methylobacterium sp. A49B]